MVKTVVISPSDAVNIWSDVLPFIKQALEYNGDELDHSDVLYGILSGTFLLGVTKNDDIITTVGVLEIANFPKKRVCNITLLSSSNIDVCRVHSEAWGRHTLLCQNQSCRL